MREKNPQTEQELTAICFGGASLDVFALAGDVGPDHRPGEKTGWTSREDERLQSYLDDPHIDQYVGGNAFNVAAYFSQQPEIRQTAFAGMLCVDDFATRAIKAQMNYLGIKNECQSDERFSPSVSIIEREKRSDGTIGDRMVRGRPRGPQEIATERFSERVIETIAASADIVAVASLKNDELTRRVFEESNGKAFKSWNPGSDEFKNAESIRKYLHRKSSSIKLLALNEQELAMLLDEDNAPDTVEEAKRLLEKAAQRNITQAAIVCTLGKNGLLLARSGTIFSQPVAPIPEGNYIVDTLGAGDRVHAVTALGLAQKKAPQIVLQEAAKSATQVICHEGAHGDLLSHNNYYKR